MSEFHILANFPIHFNLLCLFFTWVWPKKTLFLSCITTLQEFAKPRVDCRNSESWYSFNFLYLYGLFLIYKSQKRRQKFYSYTCSNLFARNLHTPQRLVFNYLIFSTPLFQSFNLITMTKSATLDSKSDKRHCEYGKSIIWISFLMNWQVAVVLLSYALDISVPRRQIY